VRLCCAPALPASQPLLLPKHRRPCGCPCPAAALLSSAAALLLPCCPCHAALAMLPSQLPPPCCCSTMGTAAAPAAAPAGATPCCHSPTGTRMRTVDPSSDFQSGPARQQQHAAGPQLNRAGRRTGRGSAELEGREHTKSADGASYKAAACTRYRQQLPTDRCVALRGSSQGCCTLVPLIDRRATAHTHS